MGKNRSWFVWRESSPFRRDLSAKAILDAAKAFRLPTSSQKRPRGAKPECVRLLTLALDRTHRHTHRHTRTHWPRTSRRGGCAHAHLHAYAQARALTIPQFHARAHARTRTRTRAHARTRTCKRPRARRAHAPAKTRPHARAGAGWRAARPPARLIAKAISNWPSL
eukprot:1688757-Pleurochrysis_carterae.AAC.5